MKFFTRILSLIFLFSIVSMDAKKKGAQATPAAKPTVQPAPVQPPVRAQQPTRVTPAPSQQSTTQPQSYVQALNIIKTKMTADQVLINNTFNPQFINFVKSLNLSAIETEALLQAGANLHATWSDNNETNKNILSSLRTNIQIIMHTQPTTQPQPAIWQNQPTTQPQPAIWQNQPTTQPQPTIWQNQPTMQPQPAIWQNQPTMQPQPAIWQNQPTMQPQPVAYIQPIVQPRAIEIPKPVMPIEQPKPVAISKPIMPIEQPKPVVVPKTVEQPISIAIPKTAMPIEQPKPVAISKPIMPIEQARPVIAPKPITQSSSINQVPRDLLGKVKKLEGYDGIYVGAGISAAGEPIFFAMEKLNDERNEVWQKYIAALFTSYYTQVIARLRKLNNKCDDKVFLETLKDDPYTKKLMEQMCPQKKKFSALFGDEDGIGGGIVGFNQMLYRYSEDGDVVYVVYASSQPITGPFKPKKEIAVSSFTLEDFETAYSDLIICVAVDMMQKLKFPISTEHRGIFKNPFNEIRGGYKNIGVQLHAWAGTVEEQFFNKKYMTVFPTEHAAKLLHSSTKKGEMFLGTDKKPFPYNNYYKNDEELKLIKEKFPPIQQDLIGDAPTTSRGGGLEHLHVFPLNTLSPYYTNQGK